MTLDKNSQYHHGDVPSALMSAALIRIKQDGVEKLSLRALARDIGVSQTAPYRHFKDKTRLLVSLARAGFAKLAMEQQAAAHNKLCLDNLIAVGVAYVEFAMNHPEQYKLMFGSKIENRCQHPDLMESSMASFQVVLNQAVIGVESGLLVDKDPHYLARCCWANVHGIASLLIDGFYDNLDIEFKDFLTQQITFNIRGILKEPALIKV